MSRSELFASLCTESPPSTPGSRISISALLLFSVLADVIGIIPGDTLAPTATPTPEGEFVCEGDMGILNDNVCCAVRACERYRRGGSDIHEYFASALFIKNECSRVGRHVGWPGSASFCCASALPTSRTFAVESSEAGRVTANVLARCVRYTEKCDEQMTARMQRKNRQVHKCFFRCSVSVRPK